MTERIAIVGGSVRAAAASVARAGLQPVAADRFGDDDLRRIAPTTRIENYPDGLVAWLRTLRPRPTAWMYTGALENHPDLVDQMAAVCPLWGNRGAVLRQVRSPWRLAEVLREVGHLFPETRATADGLPRDGSWLVKTCRGAGGSGVGALAQTGKQSDKETRRQGEGERDEGGAGERSVAASNLPVSLSPCLLVSLSGRLYQKRVIGEPCAAVFVAAAGAATLLGVVRQLVGEDWLGAREFHYCGAVGPRPCAEAVLAEIGQIGNVLAEHFGLVGLFGVDLVIEGERVWCIEVNPRYTASVEVVERATGLDAMTLHAQACIGERPSRATPSIPPLQCGKAIVFAKRKVTISAEFVGWAMRQPTGTQWPNVADVSPARTTIAAGQPVMTALAAGATDASVDAELRNRVAQIEERLYSDHPASE